jgi:hypothetical protein
MLISIGFGLSAKADISSIGIRMNVGEYRVEVSSAEVDSNNEEEVLSSLVDEIVEARSKAPESRVETGWYIPKGIEALELSSRVTGFGRSPAEEPKSKARILIEKLEGRLSERLVRSDHTFGRVDPKVDASQSFYLRNSNAIFSIIRLSTSYGGRVATFVMAGYGLTQSLELGVAVAAVCGVTAMNYDWLMRAIKYDRVYNLVKPGVLPALDRLRADSERMKKIDRIHQKVNWGLMEAAFTVGLLGLEFGFGKVLGVPVAFPSFPEISMSFLATFNSQQVWDRAVNRYEDLLNLQPNLNQDFKNTSLRKRRALGSVISVVSMAASAMPNAAIKIGGFAALIGLRQAGVYYEKIVDSRLAQEMTQVSSCDLLTTR